MIKDPENLISQFITDARKYLSLEINSALIKHDIWEAPHIPKNLPLGYGAIYVFSLSKDLKAGAPEGRVLKVGKAGSKSNPRFKYQHYKIGSAMSTLAGAIENNPLLWGYIGYPGIEDIGTWIKENTDRNNFYIIDKNPLDLFEVYAKCKLGPVFEGSLSSSTNKMF